MTDLLFHTPWWLPTTIVAAGIILFLAGNKRTKATLRNVGAVVAGLGVLLAVVSYLVDTDVEQVEKRTRQLVESAGRQDWKTVESLLAPDARFSFNQTGGRRYGNRGDLLDGARRAAERTGLRSAFVTSLEPQQTGGLITTAVRVFSDQEKLGHQIPSDWQLDWEKHDGKWVVGEIRLIQVGNVAAEEINQVMPVK